MKLHTNLIFFVILFVSIACTNKTKSEKSDEKESSKDTEMNIIEEKIPNSCIAIATPSLAASLEFWTKLGFQIVDQGTEPYPFAYICDGSALIGLFEDGDSYLGFSMWVSDINTQVKKFVDSGFLVDPDYANEKEMTVVITPDSLTGIALLSMKNTFPKLRIKSMLHMQESEYPNEKAYPNSILGVFAEFSIPVKSINETIPMWESAGFSLILKQVQASQSYAILSDDEIIIGLHEDADFEECAITYFAPDARKRIDLIKNTGITQIKDLTDKMPVDGDKHFIITTPEGKLLFVFSLM